MQHYTITHQHSSATLIPERGGMISSIIMQGAKGPRELLFLETAFDDPASSDLPGGAPFCFPICGRLSREGETGVYLYHGQQYHLDMHGFAWRMPWRVTEHSDVSLALSLSSNEDTLRAFPFLFTLNMVYTIADNHLCAELEVINNGDHAMPYYAGFHPYFLMPDVASKQAVMLDFNSTHRYQYNDALTDVVGQMPPLSFPSAVSEPALNESLNVVQGDSAFSLRYPDGDVLRMQVGSQPSALFPFIQLYTREDAPFMCVEQWMGHPNAMNTAGAVRYLPAGEKDRVHMILTLE